MIARLLATLGLTAAAGVILQACGHTGAGGDSGSETHWLAKCEQSSDCERGECLCGVCTVACSTASDCPAPLDQCLDVRPDGAECQQFLCQSSEPSAEPSSSQESQLQQVIATCDDQRPTSLARIMSTEAQVLEDPGIGVASHVVANVGGGFVLLDGAGAATLLASDGSFVRKFSSPFDGVQVTDAAVLPDGSAYVVGSTGNGAWLGKVDAHWRLSWQKQLSYSASGFIDVEPLPDGSAVVAGTGQLPLLQEGMDRSETYVAFWARVTPDGVLSYEKALSYEGAFNALGMLAVSATSFHVAISSLQGITLVTSDFEGNYSSQVLKEGIGGEVRDVRSLPDGRVALLDRTELLLADETGPLWEYPLDPDLEAAQAIGFDQARSELIIAGGYGDETHHYGTWLRSLDVSGTTTWELRRLARPAGFDDASQMGVYGDLLYDVAVDEGGNILGLGTFRAWNVNLLWVGNAACP